MKRESIEIENGNVEEVEVESRSRRHLIRMAAGGAGLIAMLGVRQVLADDDDDDDDNSGHGSGGDDNSGHGGGDDDNSGRRDGDDPVITGEIPAGSVEIWIDDDDADAFEPGDLTVDLGQSVTFINADKHRHTATGSGFDTGIMEPGETATVVLDTPGRFAYACQIHPIMTGTIAVRDENGQVPEQAAAPSSAGATPVRIVSFAFDPAMLSIATGTTVAWTNDDTVPHTVTASDGSFDSGIFDPGASFAWEFLTPGTFEYRCALHTQMVGTIEVTGDPIASTSASPAASPAAEATPQASPAAENGAAVSIHDFAFDPPSLEVTAGTTVTWTNQDAVPHTATAPDFNTGTLDQGQSGTVTFDTPGRYQYGCAFHPDMLGEIVVS